MKHLNQYDVIYIDCSVVPEGCNSYLQYIQYISQGIKADLADAYPSLNLDNSQSLWDILMKISAVKDDLALMISGERIPAKIQEYAATVYRLESKDQIYSAMVVYGLLTYEDGRVFIPNRELMAKYEELLLHKESLGYIYELASISNKMLYATLHGDTATMTSILQQAHNAETPILAYNHETELAAIVNLVYLAARNDYHIEREDKAGKGYVDFIFYPNDPCGDGIILELKVDKSPKEAIRQIREREYILRFQGKVGERPRCTGRILAVGIGYNRESKEHRCLVEVLR